ncbi:phage tail-collar fiber domain-containing protein [Citrobacter freundii]
MADYYSIITNRGKELEAEAIASGRRIVLTQFVVGDSNGKQVQPDPAQIRLINETYRGDIADLVVSPEQFTQLMAKIVLPTDVGGFTVREVGLMTDAGELYAVANCPAIDKPVGGVSVNMQFRLAVSDTSNITLNVATGDGLFLRIDQNLKEIKARGAEAQKASRESIGVLDGTTQQRGLVQLNSAVNSTSETQAATPAAVKIAMDNANARLAKDRNGADIPNPPLFVQNIGLQQTVNKAAGALQKDQNGADIPDKISFLRNVGAIPLNPHGTIGNNGRMASAATPGWWVVSVSDTATVADFPMTPDGSKLYGYGFLFVGRTGDVWVQQYFSHNGTNATRQTWSDDMSESVPWVIDYTTAYKPTAGDVGALPIAGGTINGSLGIGTPNALGGHSVVLGDNDTGLKQNGDGILDVYTNNAHVFRFANGVNNSIQPLRSESYISAKGGVYEFNGSQDVRVYSPHNPPPATDLSAYATMSWVLQNFVQNIDLTAPTEFQFWDGRGYMRPTDGAAMYNFSMVGGSSNVGWIQIRYTRKLVNNTWYVLN